MKKLLIILLFLIVNSSVVDAQTRYAFVDTEYILSKIPEYEIVKKQLNEISLKWQKEIEDKNSRIDSLYQKLKIDQVFLPSAMKEKRLKDISKLEIDLKTTEKRYFGKKGELFKRRQELIKPILEDVFDAIKDIAVSGNYGAIFDRASGISVVYFNPRLDKSDSVLERLGYKK